MKRTPGAGATAPKRRVVHVVTNLSQGGGVQVVVRRLAAAADPARVEFHAVTARSRSRSESLDGVPIEIHPLDHDRRTYSILDRFRLMAGVARTVRRLRPDVVQLHSGLTWLGALARITSPRTAFVLEVHDAPGSGRHRPRTDRIEGLWVRRLGATVICHTSSVAADIQAHWHPKPGRVVVFPLGVDVERFTPRDASDRAAWRDEHGIDADLPVAAAVGRFVHTKRFCDAIDAVADANERGVDLGLVLVGRGPEDDALAKRIVDRGAQDRIWIIGPRFEGLPRALGSCDLLLSTSEYEGFGLTLVEGMACGLPVVTRSVGGVVDLVEPDRSGLLVPPEGIEPVRDALMALAPDAARRAAMGERGRALAVASFSTTAMASSFLDAYEQAIGGRRGR